MKSNLKVLLVTMLAIFFATSCNKDSVLEETTNNEVLLKNTFSDDWMLISEPAWFIGSENMMFDVCSESEGFPFYESAHVTFSNDEEFVYIKVVCETDWYLRELYVNVWSVGDPSINADYLNFPYHIKIGLSELPSTAFFKIPKDESWDNCLVFNLKMLTRKVIDGVILEERFRWVTNDNVPYSRDYYLEYCMQDCECYPYRTQTPGGWGAPAHGNNPGTYRDENFSSAFPNGLVVGGDYTISLTTASAVEAFLPSGGKPLSLTDNYIDPNGKTLKNSFAGHVVALTLSVVFDAYDEDFSMSTNNLGDLVFAEGTGFDNKTVQEILDEANTVLGGGASDYTIEELSEVLSKINEYYVDGTWTGDGTLFNDCWTYEE